MSLESWKAEFYPVPANEVTKEESIRHSLQKWRGLTTENLERHGMEWNNGEIMPIDDIGCFEVNGDSCSLCLHYYASVGHDRCLDCPLFRTTGEKCGYSDEDAFGIYRLTGNPLPMIEALEKTLANAVVE